jgi:hypothetical protein
MIDVMTLQILYEARGPIDYAYFPVGAVLSALTVMQDGNAIEVATIGNEGLVGHYGSGGNPCRFLHRRGRRGPARTHVPDEPGPSCQASPG